jgi:hypothetical protein
VGRIGDGVRAEESLKEKGRSAKKNLQGDESGEDEDEKEKK